MKHKFGTLVASIVSILGLSGALLFSPAVYAAGTATLTLSPASGKYTKGQTISVIVYENSGGDSVNAVQSNLSYNTSQLKYLNFTDSSAFNIEAESPSGDTGNLHFARGTINAVTGTQAVVTARFSVVAGSGSATISFASGSTVVRSTDNQPESLTTSSGSYTLATATSPSPSPSPSPTSHPSSPTPPPATTFVPPASTTKPNTSTHNPNSSTKLTVTNVQSTNGGSGDTTIITWQTNVPSTSTVLYGSDKDHLVSQSDGSLVTSHSVTLPASELKSGSTYYFYVSSTDANGSTVSSQLIPFVAAGDTVSSNSQKLNKQIFTIVGIGAVILAGILVLFGIYRLQQSMKEQRELRSHFPDVNNNPSQNNTGGVVNFTPPNGTPGSTTQPNPNQPNQDKKI